MLLALITNNIVCGIYQPIDDDDAARVSAFFSNAVDITDAYPQPQIGWLFDGNKITRTDGTNAIDMRVTKLACRERFTQAELMGLLAASAGTSTMALAIQMIMGNLQVATYVDLARTDTIAAVQTLVTFGLLTSDRAHTILTALPTATEQYQG